MKVSEEDLKQAHRLGADAASGRRGCPEAETLARAASGGLQGGEREQLSDHIGSCRDCADEYRLLVPLRAWSEDAAQSSGRAPHTMRAPWSRPFAIPHALAASLLVACLGLTFWNLSLRRELDAATARERQLAARQAETATASSETGELRRQIETLAQPQLNVPIVDLESDTARGGAGTSVVELPAEATSLTAILHRASSREFPSYSVEILDASGRPVWRGAGLRKNADGSFTLALPTRLLSGGEYRIRVLGGSGGAELLDEYRLTLRRR